MAFQSVPDTVQVAIEAQYLGEPCVNTLHFEATGTYDLTAAQSLAALIVSDWAAGFMAVWSSNQYIFESVSVRGLEFVNDFQWTESAGNVAGGAAADPLPGNAAWVVKFISGLTGRSARGRNYISGLSSAVVNGNTLAATAAAAIVDTYEQISADAAVLGWSHVITSRFTSGAARPVGVNFPVAAVTYSDLDMDSMRRRLAGRGA